MKYKHRSNHVLFFSAMLIIKMYFIFQTPSSTATQYYASKAKALPKSILQSIAWKNVRFLEMENYMRQGRVIVLCPLLLLFFLYIFCYNAYKVPYYFACLLFGNECLEKMEIVLGICFFDKKQSLGCQFVFCCKKWFVR